MTEMQNTSDPVYHLALTSDPACLFAKYDSLENCVMALDSIGRFRRKILGHGDDVGILVNEAGVFRNTSAFENSMIEDCRQNHVALLNSAIKKKEQTCHIGMEPVKPHKKMSEKTWLDVSTHSVPAIFADYATPENAFIGEKAIWKYAEKIDSPLPSTAVVVRKGNNIRKIRADDECLELNSGQGGDGNNHGDMMPAS